MILNTKQQNSKHWVVIGCILAAIGVAFGAIGAHMLEKWLADNFEDASRREELWDTGVRYQMYCAFGLVCIGLVGRLFSCKLTVAGSLMLVGALLFSGCLYGYVLTDIKPLVHIVPIGGLAMIVAWGLFAWSALTAKE